MHAHGLNEYMSSDAEHDDSSRRSPNPARRRNSVSSTEGVERETPTHPNRTRRGSTSAVEKRATQHTETTRDRGNLKKWLESRHRKENAGEDDIMSIVTTGDERVSSDDDDDPTYGDSPSRARSRVGTIISTPQKNRSTATSKKQRRADRADDKPAQHTASRAASGSAVSRELTPPPVLSPKELKARARAAMARSRIRLNLVCSDSDNGSDNVDGRGTELSVMEKDQKGEGGVPSRTRVASKHRVSKRAPFPMTGDHRSNSSELLEAFVDEEAVESDGEGGDRPVNSDGENALVKGTADDYDYSDPFIDDGDLSTVGNKPTQRDRAPVKKNASAKGVLRGTSRQSLYHAPTTPVPTKRKTVAVIEIDSGPEEAAPKKLLEPSLTKALSTQSIPTKDTHRVEEEEDEFDGPHDAFPRVRHQANVTPSPKPFEDDDFVDLRDLSPWERAEMWKAYAATRKATRRGGISSTDPSTPLGTNPQSPSVEQRARREERKGKGRQRSASPALPSKKPRALLNPGSDDEDDQFRRDVEVAMAESKKTGAPVASPDTPSGSGSRLTGTSPEAPCGPTPFERQDSALVRRCIRLPPYDATFDTALHDPLLVDVYALLPNLHEGHLIPWTTLLGTGHPLVTVYGSYLPHLPMKILLEAINFVGVNGIRNPSRISPLDVTLRSSPGTGNKFNFYCDTNPPTPLIAVSTMWLERSQLVDAAPTGLRQRYVTGKFFSQEWQRFTGFVATASGYPELHAQLARDALQFSTRAQSSQTSSPGGSSGGKKRGAIPSNMFVQSASSGNSRAAADSFSLANDVAVPVYDARGLKSLKFSKVLPSLADYLPLYNGGEIPQGSCVMVGYTMTVYTANSGNRTLGCNVMWIVVLATPED